MSEETTAGSEAPARSTFKDALGVEWHPTLRALALIKICRTGQITIANLMDKNVNVGDLIEALWYACEVEAEQRKITREDFLGERLGMKEVPEAIAALWAAIREAFPQLADIEGIMGSMNMKGGGKKGRGPLDRGRS